MRKCWACGHISEHLDSVVPYVLCKICGSQDTRRIEQSSSDIESIIMRQAAETAIYNLRGNAKELHTIASLALTALYECVSKKGGATK